MGPVYTSVLDHDATSGRIASPTPDTKSVSEATEAEESAVAEEIEVLPDWDRTLNRLLERSWEAHEQVENPDTPGPTGPLMMEGIDYDVPEADLGSPLLGAAGEEEGADNGEGSSSKPMLRGEEELDIIQALSVEEYNAAQNTISQTDRGQGKEKEEPETIHDQKEVLLLNLARFQTAGEENLRRDSTSKNETLEEIKADNLANIQAANKDKGKGKENAY